MKPTLQRLYFNKMDVSWVLEGSSEIGKCTNSSHNHVINTLKVQSLPSLPSPVGAGSSPGLPAGGPSAR